MYMQNIILILSVQFADGSNWTHAWKHHLRQKAEHHQHSKSPQASSRHRPPLLPRGNLCSEFYHHRLVLSVFERYKNGNIKYLFSTGVFSKHEDCKRKLYCCKYQLVHFPCDTASLSINRPQYPPYSWWTFGKCPSELLLTWLMWALTCILLVLLCVSFCYVPRNEIARLYVHMFNFRKGWQMVFQSGYNCLHFSNSVWVSIVPCDCHPVLWVFLIMRLSTFSYVYWSFRYGILWSVCWVPCSFFNRVVSISGLSRTYSHILDMSPLSVLTLHGLPFHSLNAVLRNRSSLLSFYLLH